MRRTITSLIVAAAIVAAACGGKSTTPTAPSNSGAGASTSPTSPAGPAVPTGATVMGRVQSAAQGATIGVAGTSTTAALDTSGGFNLPVAPGDVQLRVNSAGSSATVGITAVQPAQTVEVVITMNGSSARIDSEVRHGGSEAEAENEVNGVVDTVPPTTPALTFKIGSKIVVTTASTVFRDGPTNTFADIKIGVTIEAKGSLSGDTLTATSVEIKAAAGAPPAPGPNPNPNPNPAPREGELKGSVSGLTGTASSFTFTVNGTTVKGNSSTVFKDGTFASLKNGVQVEVKGTQNTDGSLQAQTIELDENEVENEAEIKGVVAGLTGTASSFTFTVNGTTVKGNSATVFSGNNGDVSDHGGGGSSTATFADLKNGANVEVKGTRNTDGSVQAQQIQIEEANENEPGEAEVEGTLGAVTGTCPAISSTVNGTKFTASASTRFDSPCSSFASGNKVEVDGTRNTDGSIKATRLRKK